MTHHIHNHTIYENFRFGHHNQYYNRPSFRGGYPNSVFGGYPPYGNPYGNPYAPQEPKPSFIDRIFPFAAAGFIGYQVGKAPGNNFGEKVGGFLSGVGKFVGGLFGSIGGNKSSDGTSSGGGLFGFVGKLLGGIFGGK